MSSYFRPSEIRRWKDSIESIGLNYEDELRFQKIPTLLMSSYSSYLRLSSYFSPTAHLSGFSVFSETYKRKLKETFLLNFWKAVTYGMIAKKRQLTIGCRNPTIPPHVAMMDSSFFGGQNVFKVSDKLHLLMTEDLRVWNDLCLILRLLTQLLTLVIYRSGKPFHCSTL